MSCCCSTGSDCCSDNKTEIVFSCSGASNTGMLADRVWRNLKSGETYSGSCLSAIGAGLSGYVVSAKSSDRNIVIDGCAVACGKKIFEAKEIPFDHVLITDYGVEKGKTEISDKLIEEVTGCIRRTIGER